MTNRDFMNNPDQRAVAATGLSAEYGAASGVNSKSVMNEMKLFILAKCWAMRR